MNGLKGMEKSFTVSGENAGLHILLQDRRGRNEEELVGAAAKAGVRVYGLSEFCVGEMAPQWKADTVALGYASLRMEQIEEGMKRLRDAWA